MSVEIDDTVALGNAFYMAHNHLSRTLSAHAIYTTVTAYVPKAHEQAHEQAPVLDAWADYMIAKRRYERALIASRRGVQEID